MTDDRGTNDRIRGVLTFIIVSAIVVSLALTLDGWVLAHVHDDIARRKDWHRLLRIVGFLPSWLLAGAVLFLIDRSRPPSSSPRSSLSRGAYISIVVIAAGLGAEALKLLLRRLRPHGSADYVFRAFWDHPLSTTDLGLPSSHAMVAFAGAFAMCRLVPEAKVVWIALAAGCAMTRLLDGSHFLSDVAVAGLAGYAVAWALRPRPRRATAPGEAPQIVQA